MKKYLYIYIYLVYRSFTDGYQRSREVKKNEIDKIKADLNVRKDMQSLASLAASVRPAGEKKTRETIWDM